MNILGILWDYDGTMVDSAEKNRAVTIEVLKYFDKEIESHLPDALRSYEKYQRANHAYKNWRDLYQYGFGLKESQLDEAGKLWAPLQLKNKKIPDMFEGLPDLFRCLKPVKMGICSQNANKNIKETLKYYGVDDCFEVVVGYDDVAGDEQKPNPEGFIKCVHLLEKNDKDGVFIYIGDHSEDVVFAKNAQKKLEGNHVSVIGITIDHLKRNGDQNWVVQPDYFVSTTKELEQILRDLLHK